MKCLITILVAVTALSVAGRADAKFINFAGQSWSIKRGGPKGPGPNEWSDSADSVWVDAQGQLHLKIRQINGVWHSAEITARNSTGYGNYRFKIASDTHQFDRNTVVGLFNYANDFEEIDVEMSRWANPSDQDVGQFVVQPANVPGNLEGFSLAQAGALTTHAFNWQPDSIFFQSHVGHADAPATADLIHQYRYTGAAIPPLSSAMKTHINFWQASGLAPSNGLAVELIVSDFSFTPAIDGDLNGDGFVGIEDLNLVLGAWNQSAPLPDLRSDPTGDSFVGIEDLNVVLSNWNAGTPPPPGAVVPEPGTAVALGLAGMALIGRRTRSS